MFGQTIEKLTNRHQKKVLLNGFYLIGDII